MKMSKLVTCVRRLVAAGYPADRALACVFYAFALTPDQLALVRDNLGSTERAA